MSDITDLATQCIRCGFCLESCPTFKLTGQETESPRGRIYLIRGAEEGLLDWKADVKPHTDLCLGCRACETACPSGVQYGQLLEQARVKMEEQAPSPGKRAFLGAMTNPAVFRTQLLAGKVIPQPLQSAVLKIAFGKRAKAPTPTPVSPPGAWGALQESDLPPVKGEVYLLEGCVMRVMYPRVHEATRRLLRRIGYTVKPIDLGCCGALHAHAGFASDAKARASHLARLVQTDDPKIIVNSAGCGSTMKEYNHLDETLAPVAKRVQDISEFLLTEGLVPLLQNARGFDQVSATYHDACHLCHGQLIKDPPRVLLQAIPGLSLSALPESDLCCGSAGTYSIQQPEMATELVYRKWGNIKSTGAHILVMGNPGCHSWIEGNKPAGSGVKILHLAEILESAFSGLPGPS